MEILKISILCVFVAIVGNYVWRKVMKYDPNPVVEGNFDPRFRLVAETFRENLQNGLEIGGSFAVYWRGELVVDLWGGAADVSGRIPWRNYTICGVASVTKAISVIALSTLVKRGLLDFSRKVVDYWPEFGAHNKDNITVKMLLSHQAGLTCFEPPIPLWKLKTEHGAELISMLAKQKPIWPPGTDHGYHLLTYGFWVDALTRLIDPGKRGMAQLFHDEVAVPFDIDFTIGVPLTENYRVARFHQDSLYKQFCDAMSTGRTRALSWSYLTNTDFTESRKAIAGIFQNPNNDPELRAIPTATWNGFGTARAIAKLFGILANGGSHHGKQLLSVKEITELSTPIVSGIDRILQIPSSYSAGGFWITKNPKGEAVFGHSGYGGNQAYSDSNNKLGIAYITNHRSIFGTGNDPRFLPLEKAVYECIDKANSKL